MLCEAEAHSYYCYYFYFFFQSWTNIVTRRNTHICERVCVFLSFFFVVVQFVLPILFLPIYTVNSAYKPIELKTHTKKKEMKTSDSLLWVSMCMCVCIGVRSAWFLLVFVVILFYNFCYLLVLLLIFYNFSCVEIYTISYEHTQLSCVTDSSSTTISIIVCVGVGACVCVVLFLFILSLSIFLSFQMNWLPLLMSLRMNFNFFFSILYFSFGVCVRICVFSFLTLPSTKS